MQAQISGGAEVYTSGAVTVKASSTYTPDISVDGGSLGLVAVGAAFLYVNVWGAHASPSETAR